MAWVLIKCVIFFLEVSKANWCHIRPLHIKHSPSLNEDLSKNLIFDVCARGSKKEHDENIKVHMHSIGLEEGLHDMLEGYFGNVFPKESKVMKKVLMYVEMQ